MHNKIMKRGILMQKKISRTTYDTETATLLNSISYGEFGNPTGYEEQLYKTRRGKLFVHGVGGAESKYHEADIWEISDDDALSQFGVSI